MKLEDIIEFCKNNSHAKTCVFPFVEKHAHDIKRIEVVNPFFSQEALGEELPKAITRLKEKAYKKRAVHAFYFWIKERMKGQK